MSERAHISERCTAGPDGSRLDYTVAVTDHENLVGTAFWGAHWAYVPGTVSGRSSARSSNAAWCKPQTGEDAEIESTDQVIWVEGWWQMKLDGSCHCGSVRFSLESEHPYPFNLCYCSICRKTAGGGGFAINLGGEHATLEVHGEENVSVYSAETEDEASGQRRRSPAQRSFCRKCGSALWVWDPRWPELVHPFASAIDTPLPVPPERTHLMVGSKAPWVELGTGPHDKVFDEYPDESIAAWHERLGLAR